MYFEKELNQTILLQDAPEIAVCYGNIGGMHRFNEFPILEAKMIGYNMDFWFFYYFYS